jgi:hypothetical protein
MSIKGMKDVYRPNKLGRIGLGIKVAVEDEHGEVRMKNGEPVTRPQATDYFVVPDDVAALPEIGPQPKQLQIYFLMDREEEVFPHNLMLYSGRGLVCMGDGDQVLFRRHGRGQESEVLIYGRVAKWDQLKRNGVLDQWASQEGYGTAEKSGNTVRCLNMECPRQQKGFCKPTGMLRFGIQGIIRQGYWQLTVHLRPMQQLLSQLRHGREWIEQYCGRPTIMHADWLLTLTGPEKEWIDGHLRTIYIPELELDPAWMERAMAGRVRLPRIERLTEEDVYGPAEPEPALDSGMLEDLPYDPTPDSGDDEIPF